MKIKQRIMSILLTMSMLLAFMSAMAFAGEYKCDATDGEETNSETYAVNRWWIENDGEDFYYRTAGENVYKAEMTCETDYDIASYDEAPAFKYQWYVESGGDSGWTLLNGATEKSYTASITNPDNSDDNSVGYKCEVSVDDEIQESYYNASFDTEKYNFKAAYPDAYAEYVAVDGRKLAVNYTEEEEKANFPAAGDEIIIYDYEGAEGIRYTCSEDDVFENNGKRVYCSWEENYSDSGLKLHIWSVITSYNHNKSEIIRDYDIYTMVDAEIVTDVASLAYSPSSINVYSEDIKTVNDDGTVVYSFRERAVHSCDGSTAVHLDGGTTWGSKAAAGDRLLVTFKDGTSKEYVNEDYINFEGYYDDAFFCGDEKLWLAYSYPESLSPGDNTITISYHGVKSSINVYMDTPELRAQRAAAEKAAAQNINKTTVTAADIKKASDLGATSVTLGAKVKKISANTFKGTNIKTVTVKTRKLKASKIKGSLKGSKVTTIKINLGQKKVNKTYIKKYKKIFTKKIVGKKVKVK